jgi:ribosomal protein S27E
MKIFNTGKTNKQKDALAIIRYKSTHLLKSGITVRIVHVTCPKCLFWGSIIEPSTQSFCLNCGALLILL